MSASRSSRLSRLFRALEAVGHTVEEQVRWLAAFAERDLVDDNAREQVRWEIEAFCQRNVKRHDPGHPVLVAEIVGRGPVVPLPDFIREEEPQVPRELVPRLQLEARRYLKALRDEGEYRFEKPVFTGTFDRLLITNDRDPEARFIGTMISLVLNAKDLAFCADSKCGSPFLRSRSWNRYCSSRCSNRATQKNFRARQAERRTPEDLSDQRHERYAKTLRKAKSHLRSASMGRRPRRRKGSS